MRDAIAALALLGALVLVPTLGWNNLKLRHQARAGTTAAIDAVTETLRHAVALSAIEGSRLPESIAHRLRSAPRHSTEQPQGFLVVAFTPTVCGSSLRAGLGSLQNIHSPSQPAAQRTTLHALVGEQTRYDREYTLRLREEGLLPFSTSFIPTETLSTWLFSHLGDDFPQEPLYLRVDTDFRVVTAFQADQRRPELLDQWLTATMTK